MLLARIYQAFPLTCPICGAEMRLIAFITDPVDMRVILEHIGKPATPPGTAQPAGRPSGMEDSGDLHAWDDDGPMQATHWPSRKTPPLGP